MDIHDVHYIYTFVCCLNLHAYIDQDIVPKIHFCNHHIPVVFSNFNLAYCQSVPEWLRLEAWVFFLYFCYKKKYTHVPSVKFWIWKVPFNTHCELCLSLLDFALGNHGWWNVGQCRSKWCRLNNADSSYLTIYANLTCLRAEIPVNHLIS